MKSLIHLIKSSEQFKCVTDAVSLGRETDVYGLTPSFKPYFLAALSTLPARGLLWITASWESCERTFEQAYPYVPDHLKDRLYVFPEIRKATEKDATSSLRLNALKIISDQKPAAIVAPFRAITEDCEDFNLLRKDSISLKQGGVITMESLINRLTGLGYERNFQVERPGEFSVRGGIIDVYPPTSGPVRIEFFGDEIDSLRSFDLDSQVSKTKLDDALIYPFKEYSRDSSLVDLLPENWIIVVDDPSVIKFHAVERNFEEERDLWADFLFTIRNRNPVNVVSWSGKEAGGVVFKTRPMDSAGGNIEKLLADVIKLQGDNRKIVISTQQHNRFKELFREKGVSGVVRDAEKPLKNGKILLLKGDLHEGFVWEDTALHVITDKDILGVSPRKRRVLRTWDRTKAVKLSELSPGDLVVHISHGVGKFVKLAHLDIQGVTSDFVEMEYRKGDRLYVPVQQLDLLQKYIGPEGRIPKLSRLGGADWTKTRRKAEKAAEELAEELLKLYAERETTPGYAFSKDGVWQWELEASFPFEETDDQDHAIDQVKEDMESSRAMDRLLCGDAGYGKTEVALRAAFKAVQDGKQVALLVPTTILAYQHYETLFTRLRPFPVKVELLSRFRNRKEQRDVINRLVMKDVDVVVGTHRLLSKDVKFQDLGLLIVDEEQHFGVKHKEKLKKMRANIDVLTMTATPIPRTLYMSMSGMKDMSVIETPPDDRLPVKTYLYEYDRELIRSAIIRELERGGQVYFVNHRIKGLERIARELQELVPFARIAIGYGQMDEKDLEMVMMDFIDKAYDVLVCTTIIESGLDIPNVNTIIINNSHRFGLAQLYQLRGRVGRSNRQSYAYLLYPPHVSLTEEAEKRLEVIREFSHLGASFQVAMKDLEIRGAGNLLGPEQSGHIAAVGFSLYCQMLKEAIEEKRGKPRARELESPLVDLPVDTYIPEAYISSDNVRLEMYRKVASMEKEEELNSLAEEFKDRFGPIPGPLKNLLDIYRIKLLAWDIGAPQVKEVQGKVQILLPGVKSFSLKKVQTLFEKTGVSSYFHRAVLTLQDLLEKKKKILGAGDNRELPEVWIPKLDKVMRVLLDWKQKKMIK